MCMACTILCCFVGNVILLSALVLTESLGRTEVKGEIPDEKWGYVTVRPHAHMFWWLYGGQTTLEERLKFPLVIWLQGGPGASGCGFGNFEEIGPLDVNLKPRNTTWLKKANLLFIDNPVGTGYSYVTDNKAFTTNVSQIAEDLLTLLKNFMDVMPVFKNIPLYIFSESYGGKMTAAFGWRLYEAVRDWEINCRFDGVALGDSSISAADSVITWGPYLYQFNLLDQQSYEKVMNIAEQTVNAVKAEQYLKATQLSVATGDVIAAQTDNVNVYNVLKHNSAPLPTMVKSTGNRYLDQLYMKHVAIYEADPLTQLMNGPIKEKLGIPANVTWGGQSSLVFAYQSIEFMKPVTEQVGKLLVNAVPVVVYQGQLDMICNTAGAEQWIKKLNWPGLNKFLQAKRKPLYVKGDVTRNTAAFLKEYSYLKLYYIMKAGHMVPSDAGEMALEMLGQVINTQP